MVQLEFLVLILVMIVLYVKHAKQMLLLVRLVNQEDFWKVTHVNYNVVMVFLEILQQKDVNHAILRNKIKNYKQN